MNRKEITLFLSNTLERTKLNVFGKHYAKEVSIDPWTSKAKRVDYMQFSPGDQMSISGVEKGIFTCYEIKSCKEDVYSGNGLNFYGEKNYIVTTMECYKDLIPDLQNGKFDEHLHQCNPESSKYWGIMVAVPYMKEPEDEFQNPTPIDDTTVMGWELKVVKPCRIGLRKRSMTELLFCMLRSGR